MRIQALLLALARHLGTYAELGAAAAAEYRAMLVRRLVLAVLAATTLIAGTGVLWLVGLMALWESGWRLAYVMGTAVLLLLVAATAWVAAMNRPATGPVANVLRSELSKDVELFQQWKSTMSS